MEKQELLARLRPIHRELEELFLQDCADGEEELRPQIRQITSTSLIAAHGASDVIATHHKLGTKTEALVTGDSPQTIGVILRESGLTTDSSDDRTTKEPMSAGELEYLEYMLLLALDSGLSVLEDGGLPAGNREIMECLESLESRELLNRTPLPGAPHAVDLRLTHEGRKELAALQKKNRRFEKFKNVIQKIDLSKAKWLVDLLMELARHNPYIS